MEKLTEYREYPKWIDTMTKDEQHEWYLRIKKTLPMFKERIDTSVLEAAIKEYEMRNGIVTDENN